MPCHVWSLSFTVSMLSAKGMGFPVFPVAGSFQVLWMVIVSTGLFGLICAVTCRVVLPTDTVPVEMRARMPVLSSVYGLFCVQITVRGEFKARKAVPNSALPTKKPDWRPALKRFHFILPATWPILHARK